MFTITKKDIILVNEKFKRGKLTPPEEIAKYAGLTLEEYIEKIMTERSKTEEEIIKELEEEGKL